MAMNSSTFNFNKLPYSCLCAIFIIIAIQLFFEFDSKTQKLSYIFSQASKSDQLRVSLFIKEAKKNDQSTKIFLVGTSQSREGFDIAHLNKHFRNWNVTFYNLGAAAYSALDLYMDLDRILDAEPDLIIYMPYIGSFYQDYDFTRLKYYYNPKVLNLFWQFRDKIAIFEKWQFYIEAILADYFSLYKYRTDLRSVVYNLINYIIKGMGKVPDPDLYHYDESFDTDYFEKHINTYDSKNLFYFSEYTDIEKEAFYNSINQIKKKGIDIILINGPVNPYTRKVYDPKIEIDYYTFLNDVAKKEEIFYITNDYLPSFTIEDFIDFTHLNAYGRSKLTLFLKEYIQNQFGSIKEERVSNHILKHNG